MKFCILFDFDGVLIDTVDSLKEAYKEVVAYFGNSVDPEDFERLNGRNIGEICLFIAEKYHLLFKKKDIEDVYEQKLHHLYKKAALDPDAYETLAELTKKNIKIGVVSSAPRQYLRETFIRMGILNRFDLIVSGEDARQAKPNPDLYCIAKNYFKDYQIISVEDSLNGILSSKNAGGIYTVYYNKHNDSDIECTRLAHGAIHNIRQVLWILEAMANQVYCKAVIPSDAVLNIRQKEPDSNKEAGRAVNEIWADSCKSNPRLFNGKIACYQSHKLDNGNFFLDYFISEYQFFYIQYNHLMKLPYSVIPIGVSGILMDEMGDTLIGTRKGVTQYSGYIEFIPSGSLEIEKNGQVRNPLLQMKKELLEESGLDGNIILRAEAYCLIYDREDQVLDIGIKGIVKGSLKNHLRGCGQSREYKDIQVVNIETFAKDLLEKRYNMTPTGYALLSSL